MFNIFHWISLLAWLFIKDIYLIKDKINNVLYNQANYKKSFLYIMKESYI
jgi:predicted HAD superfamily hydrolase